MIKQPVCKMECSIYSSFCRSGRHFHHENLCYYTPIAPPHSQRNTLTPCPGISPLPRNNSEIQALQGKSWIPKQLLSGRGEGVPLDHEIAKWFWANCETREPELFGHFAENSLTKPPCKGDQPAGIGRYNLPKWFHSVFFEGTSFKSLSTIWCNSWAATFGSFASIESTVHLPGGKNAQISRSASRKESWSYISLYRIC